MALRFRCRGHLEDAAALRCYAPSAATPDAQDTIREAIGLNLEGGRRPT